MASDMTFPHRYQALIPPACYESLLASTLSTRHSHGPAAASCVTVVLMHGSLRSWHHGSLCAPPLLTGKPAAGRAQGHQGSHEEPPAPAVRRNPSCSSSLRSLSDDVRGFTERTISCPVGWVQFACVELHPAAQHSD